MSDTPRRRPPSAVAQTASASSSPVNSPAVAMICLLPLRAKRIYVKQPLSSE
jgi:hypothetical protein